MTTLAQARAEAITALTVAGLRASSTPGLDAPYVLVAGAGIDPEHVVRGQALASFDFRCIAGLWDQDATVAALDALKLSVLDVLTSLAGWQLGTAGSDVVRDYAGGMYLTADWSASRYIDIP